MVFSLFPLSFPRLLSSFSLFSFFFPLPFPFSLLALRDAPSWCPFLPVPFSAPFASLRTHGIPWPSLFLRPDLVVFFLSFFFLPVVCSQLLRDEHVIFSGYRIPHPLEHRMVVRVQTDGQKTPLVAMQESLAHINLQVQSLHGQFQQEVQRVRPADVQ